MRVVDTVLGFQPADVEGTSVMLAAAGVRTHEASQVIVGLCQIVVATPLGPRQDQQLVQNPSLPPGLCLAVVMTPLGPSPRLHRLPHGTMVSLALCPEVPEVCDGSQVFWQLTLTVQVHECHVVEAPRPPPGRSVSGGLYIVVEGVQEAVYLSVVRGQLAVSEREAVDIQIVGHLSDVDEGQ